MQRSGMNAGSSTRAESRDRFGIVMNNNKWDPRYYDFSGKDMRQVESELSQRNFETAVCFDENGKAIFAQFGNEDTIIFTKAQQRQMKGRVLTHNHPLGTPPSPEDLYVMKENRWIEFRTCGRNGTYVLRYSEKLEKLPSLEAVGKEYDDLVRKLSPEYWDQIEQGMDNRIAMAILGEKVWKELGRKYGLILEFEKR